MAAGRADITGIITATPTPLKTDGRIDREAVDRLVRELMQAGADGIAPIGGTGEYTALTQHQRRDMLGFTLESVSGRIPVIAGVLAPGIGDALEACREFIAAGADALMVVTPYYARPTQMGIIDYYKRLSDEFDADLVLYEIPYRTGVSLTPETIGRLARETRIVAMKACNQDLSQQIRTVAAAGDNISILTGEENVFPLHIAMGAKGGILASSCLFPRIWSRIHALASGGRLFEAQALHADVMPAVDALYRDHNPAPLKAALALFGHPSGDVLPPLRPASEETVRLLSATLPAAFRIENAISREISKVG